MLIASWNINGLRSRIDDVVLFIKNSDLDILCLQETKCPDDKFPIEVFNEIGYDAVIAGQMRYNGVCIIYKSHIKREDKPIEQKLAVDARFIYQAFIIRNNGFERRLNVSCIYAPNGNPINSKKFDYKIDWLQSLYDFAKREIENKSETFFLGDFNIIASGQNAANIDEWIDDSLYSTEARDIYHKIVNLGYIDAGEICSNEANYSFWDYRANSWQKNNGIRIDFIFCSPNAADKIKNYQLYKSLRGLEKPSDHTAIAIEI